MREAQDIKQQHIIAAAEPDTYARPALQFGSTFYNVVESSKRVTKTSTLVMRFQTKPQSLDLNSHYNQVDKFEFIAPQRSIF